MCVNPFFLGGEKDVLPMLICLDQKKKKNGATKGPNYIHNVCTYKRRQSIL